jgi:hypothetical protein
MPLLGRLAGLFGKKARISTVSVYLRDGRIFVVTLHGSGGGDPCIAAGPVEVLTLGSEPAELGDTILRGMARTTYDYPYPRDQAAWKRVTAPLLAAAGCKSWAEFARKSGSLRIDRIAERFHVVPSARQITSFASVVEREQDLDSPSPEQLGRLVATELAHALQRDGLG